MDNKIRTTPFTHYLARGLFFLAFLALLGAWLTGLTGGSLLGLSEQHLFYDAIVLSLFGIGMHLDG